MAPESDESLLLETPIFIDMYDELNVITQASSLDHPLSPGAITGHRQRHGKPFTGNLADTIDQRLKVIARA